MNEKNCCHSNKKHNNYIENYEKECCDDKKCNCEKMPHECHGHDHGEPHSHEHENHYEGGCEHREYECGCGHHHEHERTCACGHDHEHAAFDAKKIFLYIIGALLLVPAFLAEFEILNPWIGIVLSAIVYFLFGGEVFVGTFKDIKHGKFFTEFTLMCVATLGAIALLEFADAAAVMYLYSLGEAVSGEAYRRSKKNIASLIELDEEYVNVEKDGALSKIKASEAKVGDILSVRVGEKISLDGVVVGGEGFVDTSAITGESTPAELLAGAECLSGSVLLSGAISMKVVAAHEDSTVNRLRKAVDEASRRKAKTEKRITRFAEIFTPLAFGVALLVFGIGIFAYSSVARAARTALVILVTSCPCSLVLSVPLTYFAGIGRAAKRGIVFRGGETVDAVAAMRAIVFDKTGTLTSANLRFEGVQMSENCPYEESELLDICASALAKSPHAAADAFCRSYVANRSYKVENAENIGGRGIVCSVGGKCAAFGNAALMYENDIAVQNLDKTCIYILIDGIYCGFLLFDAPIKKGAEETIANLKKSGVSRIAIVSGDHEASVSEVARSLGIDEFYANCKPDEKLCVFEKILSEEKNDHAVAFCGDGLNDSAVIMRADIGVAMGGGSALTVESADAVIIDDSVEKLGEMRRVAKATRRIATQNIILSLGIKLAVVVIGFWRPSLKLAVVADVGAAVLTVLNAMRAGKR